MKVETDYERRQGGHREREVERRRTWNVCHENRREHIWGKERGSERGRAEEGTGMRMNYKDTYNIFI